MSRNSVVKSATLEDTYKINHEKTNIKAQTKEFKLSKNQKEVLYNLRTQMETCQWKILFLTAADFTQLAIKFSGGSMVELVTSISVFLRNLILFIVLIIGSPKYINFRDQQSTKQKNKQEHQSDIEQILSGVQKVTIVFSQLAILGTALALIQFSSAAAKWPSSTVVVSCISAVFMMIRLSVYFFPRISQICEHYLDIFLEPKQVKIEADKLVLGLDQQTELEFLDKQTDTNNETEENEFEFSREQEMVILQLKDTMQGSGNGLFLLALSDCLLILVGLLLNPLEVLGLVGGLVDDVLMAVFIVRASRRFELILGSTNHDMSLLLEGLGEKQGISSLFKTIGKVAFGVGVGKFAEIGYKLVKPYF